MSEHPKESVIILFIFYVVYDWWNICGPFWLQMEKVRRANRLFATDSLFLREYLLIPVTKDSPFYENGERVTEPGAPTHRASIAGMPTRDFSPGSPDEKKSFDDFLTRLDSSLADIKKHVEKTKENSE